MDELDSFQIFLHDQQCEISLIKNKIQKEKELISFYEEKTIKIKEEIDYLTVKVNPELKKENEKCETQISILDGNQACLRLTSQLCREKINNMKKKIKNDEEIIKNLKTSYYKKLDQKIENCTKFQEVYSKIPKFAELLTMNANLQQWKNERIKKEAIKKSTEEMKNEIMNEGKTYKMVDFNSEQEFILWIVTNLKKNNELKEQIHIIEHKNNEKNFLDENKDTNNKNEPRILKDQILTNMNISMDKEQEEVPIESLCNFSENLSSMENLRRKMNDFDIIDSKKIKLNILQEKNKCQEFNSQVILEANNLNDVSFTSGLNHYSTPNDRSRIQSEEKIIDTAYSSFILPTTPSFKNHSINSEPENNGKKSIVKSSIFKPIFSPFISKEDMSCSKEDSAKLIERLDYKIDIKNKFSENLTIVKSTWLNDSNIGEFNSPCLSNKENINLNTIYKLTPECHNSSINTVLGDKPLKNNKISADDKYVTEQSEPNSSAKNIVTFSEEIYDFSNRFNLPSMPELSKHSKLYKNDCHDFYLNSIKNSNEFSYTKIGKQSTAINNKLEHIELKASKIEKNTSNPSESDWVNQENQFSNFSEGDNFKERMNLAKQNYSAVIENKYLESGKDIFSSTKNIECQMSSHVFDASERTNKDPENIFTNHFSAPAMSSDGFLFSLMKSPNKVECQMSSNVFDASKRTNKDPENIFTDHFSAPAMSSDGFLFSLMKSPNKEFMHFNFGESNKNAEEDCNIFSFDSKMETGNSSFQGNLMSFLQFDNQCDNEPKTFF